MSPCQRAPFAQLCRAIHRRPALRVLAEHLMHNGVHLGADTDGFHDLDAEAFHQVTADDVLADEDNA